MAIPRQCCVVLPAAIKWLVLLVRRTSGGKTTFPEDRLRVFSSRGVAQKSVIGLRLLKSSFMNTYRMRGLTWESPWEGEPLLPSEIRPDTNKEMRGGSSCFVRIMKAAEPQDRQGGHIFTPYTSERSRITQEVL